MQKGGLAAFFAFNKCLKYFGIKIELKNRSLTIILFYYNEYL